MGLSVTNSLSIRLYYNSYKTVLSGATRKSATTGTISMADSSALRNAIRRLQDYDFEDSKAEQTQEKLKAFTDIMNNTLTSCAKYGKTDTSVKNATNKIKNLNNEYASELKKIGITVAKDGTMSLYDNAAKTYSERKINEFFSKDSKYLNSVYDAAKRISRRVDIRL